MADIRIELTPDEVLFAASAGLRRRVAALEMGLTDQGGYDSAAHGWQGDIEGACGECALAKYWRIYWTGTVGQLRAADVGAVQVRTRSRDDWDLPLRSRDADGAAYVLVVGAAPSYRIVGWVYGHEGKQERFRRVLAPNRPPCFVVPQSRLRPMSTLRPDGRAADCAGCGRPLALSTYCDVCLWRQSDGVA